MPCNETLTQGRLKTPRAAVMRQASFFSILPIAIIALLRIAVPADPGESGAWFRPTPGPWCSRFA